MINVIPAHVRTVLDIDRYTDENGRHVSRTTGWDSDTVRGHRVWTNNALISLSSDNKSIGDTIDMYVRRTWSNGETDTVLVSPEQFREMVK
jgi:hypothetical protein